MQYQNVIDDLWSDSEVKGNAREKAKIEEDNGGAKIIRNFVNLYISAEDIVVRQAVETFRSSNGGKINWVFTDKDGNDMEMIRFCKVLFKTNT